MKLEALDGQAYGRLRQVASRLLRGGDEAAPSSLVNEAWIRMQRAPHRYQDTGHLLAVAARAMRQILVDRARRQGAAKRGGAWHQVSLTGLASQPLGVELLALDHALTQLESLDPRRAEVVVLRFFGGLTADETASELEVSRSTVEADWRKARAFLLTTLA